MVSAVPQPVFARVTEIRAISPAMQRIVFSVPGLQAFRDAPNVKLLFAQGTGLNLPARDDNGKMVWPDPRPVVRTYSARHYDAGASRLEVDFLLHAHGGIASAWAAEARPGDQIGLAATGGRAVLVAPRYLVVADHCALPAAARVLEELPPDARGTAYLQVGDLGEVIALNHPPNLSLRWLCESQPLASHVMGDWRPEPQDVAWIGAESSDVRHLRQWLSKEHATPAARLIAVGYWRRGMTEDSYHQAFDHDRDAAYHAAQADEYRKKGIAHG